MISSTLSERLRQSSSAAWMYRPESRSRVPVSRKAISSAASSVATTRRVFPEEGERASRHAGLDHAGRDREDSDPVRSQFGGERFGEAHERRLAGHFGGLDRHAVHPQRKERAPGGDVDDPAPTTALHPGDRGSRTQVRAEDVDLEDSPPVVRLLLPERPFVASETGVRDQQVERAELGFDRRYRRLDGRTVGDVEG